MLLSLTNFKITNFTVGIDLPGIPMAEPSWANIRKSKNAETHGILLEMTRREFEKKVVKTEHQAYQVIEVECEVDILQSKVFADYFGYANLLKV